jgi:hypothetical protein
MKKQTSVLTHESNGMVCSEFKGSRGLDVNAGRGPVNWSAERRNRFAVIGPQNRGTTYQTVRVQIWEQHVKMFHTRIETRGDEPLKYLDQKDAQVLASVVVDGLV